MTPLFAKIAIGSVALAALLYVAVCALMYFQQRKLMYFPQFTQVEKAHTNFSLQREGLVLRGWQQHPGAAAAPAGDALIYLGGNAERVEQTLPLLRQWLPAHSIYTLAYRGYGASEGEPTEALMESDAIALFDEVRRLHPQAPITVVGRSLGTGVASAVADARQPSKLVLVTPFDSILNTVRGMYDWLPVSLLLEDRFDSAAHLKNYRGPILVLRAGRDQVVAPERTDALLEGLKGKTVHVRSFEQANHSSIFRAAGFWADISRFVDIN